jgi:hypothetical protein
MFEQYLETFVLFVNLQCLRLIFLYNFLYINFIDWLNISLIEDIPNSKNKWIIYTHMGRKYRLPVVKQRGINIIDQDIEKAFPDIHDQLLGPFGDYHGQKEILREMIKQ